MTTAATPGPWVIGMSTGHNGNIIYAAEREASICQVIGLWSHTKLSAMQDDAHCAAGLANARLIAAAPDLLAAVRAFIAGDGKSRRLAIDAYAKAVAADPCKGLPEDFDLYAGIAADFAADNMLTEKEPPPCANT